MQLLLGHTRCSSANEITNPLWGDAGVIDIAGIYSDSDWYKSFNSNGAIGNFNFNQWTDGSMILGTDEITIQFKFKSNNLNLSSKCIFDFILGRGAAGTGYVRVTSVNSTQISIYSMGTNHGSMNVGKTMLITEFDTLTLVLSKTDVTIYFNKNLLTTNTIPVGPLGEKMPYGISFCECDVGSAKWDGQIDDAKVYRYAKTDTSDIVQESPITRRR